MSVRSVLVALVAVVLISAVACNSAGAGEDQVTSVVAAPQAQETGDLEDLRLRVGLLARRVDELELQLEANAVVATGAPQWPSGVVDTLKGAGLDPRRARPSPPRGSSR